jgi:transcriptional regulator with XRE-family HTH domain
MTRARVRVAREGVDEELGKRIRAARAAHNRSQHWLAAQVGVRPMTICDAELGLSRPSADLIAKIANALNVDAGHLLTGDIEGSHAEHPCKTTARGHATPDEPVRTEA